MERKLRCSSAKNGAEAVAAPARIVGAGIVGARFERLLGEVESAVAQRSVSSASIASPSAEHAPDVAVDNLEFYTALCK